MKVGLYIDQWLGVDYLNEILGKPEYQEIKILYINTLTCKYTDLNKLNLPILLEHLYITLHLDNYIFMDNVFTNKRLGEYLSNEFLDYWKLPFGCNLTFRINQPIWNMELENITDLIPDQVYCEWVISNDKIVYSSMDANASIGMYQKSADIMRYLYKEQLKKYMEDGTINPNQEIKDFSSFVSSF